MAASETSSSKNPFKQTVETEGDDTSIAPQADAITVNNGEEDIVLISSEGYSDVEFLLQLESQLQSLLYMKSGSKWCEALCQMENGCISCYEMTTEVQPDNENLSSLIGNIIIDIPVDDIIEVGQVKKCKHACSFELRMIGGTKYAFATDDEQLQHLWLGACQRVLKTIWYQGQVEYLEGSKFVPRFCKVQNGFIYVCKDKKSSSKASPLLDLAVCKRIVALENSRIGLETEKGVQKLHVGSSQERDELVRILQKAQPICIKEGWMKKKGDYTGFKQRHFKLTNKRIVYSSAKDVRSHGHISLGVIQQVRNLTRDESLDFEIVTSSRIYELKCNSVPSKMDWIRAIDHAVSMYRKAFNEYLFGQERPESSQESPLSFQDDKRSSRIFDREGTMVKPKKQMKPPTVNSRSNAAPSSSPSKRSNPFTNGTTMSTENEQLGSRSTSPNPFDE